MMGVFFFVFFNARKKEFFYLLIYSSIHLFIYFIFISSDFWACIHCIVYRKFAVG